MTSNYVRLGNPRLINFNNEGRHTASGQLSYPVGGKVLRPRATSRGGTFGMGEVCNVTIPAFILKLYRVHIPVLDTPEDSLSAGSETLGPSPLETQFFMENSVRF